MEFGDVKTLLRTVIALMASSLFAADGHAQGQWAFGDSGVSDRGERIHRAAERDPLVCSNEHLARIDGGDLGMILGDRGECGGCPTDLDGDGFVDGSDLGLFLSSWGDCDEDG